MKCLFCSYDLHKPEHETNICKNCNISYGFDLFINKIYWIQFNLKHKTISCITMEFDGNFTAVYFNANTPRVCVNLIEDITPNNALQIAEKIVKMKAFQ